MANKASAAAAQKKRRKAATKRRKPPTVAQKKHGKALATAGCQICGQVFAPDVPGETLCDSCGSVSGRMQSVNVALENWWKNKHRVRDELSNSNDWKCFQRGFLKRYGALLGDNGSAWNVDSVRQQRESWTRFMLDAHESKPSGLTEHQWRNSVLWTRIADVAAWLRNADQADGAAANGEVASASGTAATNRHKTPPFPSNEELNIRARAYLREHPQASSRAIAKAIGCGQTKARTLPAYLAVKEHREREHPKAPKAVALTDVLADSIGARDEQLERLTKEQEADQRSDNAPRSRGGKAIGRRKQP